MIIYILFRVLATIRSYYLAYHFEHILRSKLAKYPETLSPFPNSPSLQLRLFKPRLLRTYKLFRILRLLNYLKVVPIEITRYHGHPCSPRRPFSTHPFKQDVFKPRLLRTCKVLRISLLINRSMSRQKRPKHRESSSSPFQTHPFESPSRSNATSYPYVLPCSLCLPNLVFGRVFDRQYPVFIRAPRQQASVWNFQPSRNDPPYRLAIPSRSSEAKPTGGSCFTLDSLSSCGLPVHQSVALVGSWCPGNSRWDR